MSREYQMCTRTVMDTTDPRITFDEKGESDYCQNFDTQIKPNWHTDERGTSELEKISDKIRQEG